MKIEKTIYLIAAAIWMSIPVAAIMPSSVNAETPDECEMIEQRAEKLMMARLRQPDMRRHIEHYENYEADDFTEEDRKSRLDLIQKAYDTPPPVFKPFTDNLIKNFRYEEIAAEFKSQAYNECRKSK